MKNEERIQRTRYTDHESLRGTNVLFLEILKGSFMLVKHATLTEDRTRTRFTCVKKKMDQISKVHPRLLVATQEKNWRCAHISLV